MRWLKYSILLLMPLLLIGWQKGGVCDGEGPIEEEWVCESRLDTLHSTSFWGYSFNIGAAGAVQAFATQISAILQLNSTGDVMGFDLNLFGDSVYIDSINIRFDWQTSDVDDTLFVGMADTIDNTIYRYYTNYDTINGATYNGNYANIYSIDVSTGYSQSLLRPYFFAYYYDRNTGVFAIAELYIYYTACYRRYRKP